MQLAKAGLSLVPGLGKTTDSAGAGSAAGAFGDILKGMVQNTMDAQNRASELSLAVASGQDVPMNQVVQALSQADLTLQTLITVRDRAVEAYQQIMQMPV